jgi:hypothetical protein
VTKAHPLAPHHPGDHPPARVVPKKPSQVLVGRDRQRRRRVLMDKDSAALDRGPAAPDRPPRCAPWKLPSEYFQSLIYPSPITPA